MNYIKYLLILLPAILLVACGGGNNSPRIDHAESIETDTLTLNSLIEDTTKVLTADFPICFDSTQILIHPIGYFDLGKMDESRFTKSYSKHSDTTSYEYTRVTDNIIYGSFVNLLFENPKNGKLNRLTNRAMTIAHIELQKELWRKGGKPYIFYTVYDKDSNRDGKINSLDVRAIYISNNDGSEFKKISPENQFFSGDRWVYSCLRYYFKTVEDSDKNGVFERTDKYHFFYVDFSVEPYQVVEYDPLAELAKP